MDATYWHRQTDTPLFPDIEWSRPERRDQAGRLLIIGGNSHGFSSVADAYQTSLSCGAGEVKLIMPDSLKNLPVIQTISECILVKSNKSGALGLDAWAEIVGSLGWADYVLLPGDLGHNPETTQLIQKIISTDTPMLLNDTVIESIISDTSSFKSNTNLVISCDFSHLQKLALALHHTPALASTMSLVQLVNALHQITTDAQLTIITEFNDSVIVAKGGEISTTKAHLDNRLGTVAAVHAMQHPSKVFQSITHAVFNK